MNLLYIFADQLHGFGLGCTGSPDARTPHLDALAARGTILRQTYSCAPVCTPARITMWTGRHAGPLGVLANDAGIPRGIPTMAEAFRAAGYLTSYVGKWHIGGSGNVPVPKDQRGGFEKFAGFQCFNEFWRDVRFFDEAGEALEFPGRHRTDATFDLATARLREAALDGRPFLLCVSEQAPHYPCQPSPEFLKPFQGRTMAVRPNTCDIDPYTPTWSPRSPAPEDDPNALAYGGDLQEYLRRYHAAVSQVDAGVGRLLRELASLGLADDTIVVFSSDHGDMQGSHGLKNKNVPFEESTRIPFVAAGPGIARGGVRDELAGTVDFLATFADLCAIAPPRTDGNSLAPALRGGALTHVPHVFSEDASGWAMVREGRWKLVADARSQQPRALYDLEADPFELENVLGRNPGCVKRLGSLLAGYQNMNFDKVVQPLVDSPGKSGMNEDSR